MPSGIYPVPAFTHSPRQARKASVGLRIKTWWQRDRLDEELAHAGDPAARPELLLRARQLLAPETRAELAAALETIVRDVRERPRLASAALAPRRAEVRAATPDLLVLAARLRDDRAIDVQGAAMTRLLVTDGTSPLYYAGDAKDVRHAIQLARLALDPVGTEPEMLREAA